MFVSSVGESSPSIRVLINKMPGLLAAVIAATIQQQPDMSLVGLVENNTDLVAAAPSCDVMILAGSQVEAPPDIINYLFSEFPYLRIIVVAINADSAVLYWLGLHRKLVPHLSPESVPDTIRHIYRLSPSE